MKKIIAFLMAALMLCSLAACGSKTTGEKNTDPSKNQAAVNTNASPEELEAAIAKALGEGYLAKVTVPEEELFLSPVGRLDMENVESYVAKQSENTSLDMDTVAVVKCKSGYADEAVKLFNEAYAQTVSYIRQYPFGVAKVEGARIYKLGDTVIYVIAGVRAGENASAEDEAKLALTEYEKIDNAIKGVWGTLPENLAVVTEPDQNNNGGDSGFIGG